MLDRCRNPRNPAYPNYGGRGITVCKRWLSFVNFYADMWATYRPGLTLDRIDNDGNYEPGNCEWATRAQQIANRRPHKKRKARRSKLADIRAYTDALARTASAAGGVRGAPGAHRPHSWRLSRTMRSRG
jgi:hypothetical protein